MSPENFSIKTEIFEGPLDLLLSLVEKRKLFISDISLSKVADDYVAYLNNHGHFPIAQSAEFLLIASTLLLIKSKSLLPALDLTVEEEESIQDLEYRLKLYQRIKELSLHVKEKFGKNIIFEKNLSKDIEPIFSPDSTMTVPHLFQTIKDVIKSIPKKELIPKAVIRKVISLEEMIENLTDRIKTSLKMSFKEFAGVGKVEKVTIIVSFLAMLELVKQGMISVTQEKEFADIDIETQNISVPKYG